MNSPRSALVLEAFGDVTEFVGPIGQRHGVPPKASVGHAAFAATRPSQICRMETGIRSRLGGSVEFDREHGIVGWAQAV
jgi:hypothetical protein